MAGTRFGPGLSAVSPSREEFQICPGEVSGGVSDGDDEGEVGEPRGDGM